MKEHKTYSIFEHLWKNDTRYIGLHNYKVPWKENGLKPIWKIRTNGASRKNGDTCFVLIICLRYIVFDYTNYNWGRK